MMKLYVSPGACSMSCHIAFEEAGLKFDPQIAKWEEVNHLNPQGAVPVLVFEDGKVLTQNIGILTYVAQQASGAHLMPKAGTYDYANAYKWLSFVGADLHKSYSPLFGEPTEAERPALVEAVESLLKVADEELKKHKYIAGDQFTLADCYLFTVYGWSEHVEIDTKAYTHLNEYKARIFERPAVQAVMKREGLL